MLDICKKAEKEADEYPAYDWLHSYWYAHADAA